ncbi:MAG TPA: tetratricopeptide repeat protein, partial [Terrimicrobiaceae bacterium]|nr:tetratricopeptide repeat protein [Terrimicrobiaceae bacterium]
MRAGLTVAAVLATGAVLSAQNGEIWQPEVRRAIPVEKPAATPQGNPEDYQNPAWMEKVRPAAPAAPQPGPEPGFTPYRPQGRIQVDPTPAPEEKPVPRAIPVHPVSVPNPPAVPAEPPVPPPVSASEPVAPAPPDADGDIRLSPAPATGDAAAEGALNLANSVYARKMYDLAIGEYEKFLISYPGAKGRDMALYRLAECHRMLGNDDAAQSGYEKLVMETREGPFAGAGAYRLGEYLFAEKKFEPAMMQFEVAAAQASEEEVR